MAVTRRRKITRGPNKGDTIVAKARSASDMAKGNWWPVRVLRDTGGRSTLRDNPGVKFGKGSRKKKAARRRR